MKPLALLALPVALLAADPALAFPTCPSPRPGLRIEFHVNFGRMTESERAAFFEQQLRARGIDAANTRFWENCIQTFVTEGGHVTMRFYDPDTLEEVR